jgi:ADP-ribosylation factor GTPase-activating protein 2/3
MSDGAVAVEEVPPSTPAPQERAPVEEVSPPVEKKEEQKVEEKPIEVAPVVATPVKVAAPTARAARSTVGARAPRKTGKTAKLGIKKAPVNFNFEAAEEQAKQDLERNLKYGADEDEEITAADNSTEEKASSSKPLSSRLAYQDNSTSSAKDKEDDYEKLGFGMSRMNMNEKSPSVSMPSQKSYQSQQDESKTARDKFGSARAISSDQYFGRNEYDPAVTAAEQSRLSQFSSAKAISSDQYFGRESDVDDRSYSNNNDVSLGDWDNVQDQAVAMARKFVDQAALDLDAVKDLAENATSRVRSYFNA